MTTTAHCHHLLRSTARSMAKEVYEEMMRDNTTYALWKKQCPELTPHLARKKFVHLLWPHLLEQARATLARLLTTNISESLKEQISDALIKDNLLREGQKRAQAIAQSIH